MRRLTMQSFRHFARTRGVRPEVIVLGAALSLGAGGVAEAQVKTTAGTVQGSTLPGTGIRVFKGIPYAAPPVGELRWQPPKPVVGWQGVRDATKFGAACLQGKIF